MKPVEGLINADSRVVVFWFYFFFSPALCLFSVPPYPCRLECVLIRIKYNCFESFSPSLNQHQQPPSSPCCGNRSWVPNEHLTQSDVPMCVIWVLKEENSVQLLFNYFWGSLAISWRGFLCVAA